MKYHLESTRRHHIFSSAYHETPHPSISLPWYTTFLHEPSMRHHIPSISLPSHITSFHQPTIRNYVPLWLYHQNPHPLMSLPIIHHMRDVLDIRRHRISGRILAIRWLRSTRLKNPAFFCRIFYWRGSKACVSCQWRQFRQQQELHWLLFPKGITFRLAVLAYMYHCQNSSALSLYIHH